MPVSLDQFVQRLADSEVLSRDDVRAVLDGQPAASRPADAEQLARLLVKQKKLTAFQAQQVYSGKGAGLVLGNYLILDKLGQGGMGMVLKAQHKRMMRTVALKVLSPNVTKTKELTQRFQREVQAAARLTHPNIVAAFDADEARGTCFLVMEYVDGNDLASVVKKKGPLPVNDAVGCVLQAAKGLEFAHKQGVIHRDIKPANLLLDAAGTVKILDMGLARLEGEAGAGQAELTSTGAVMGTIDYMAPEQALSTKSADARSDIYSLGITLWYLLVGRAAYGGESLMARMLAHREEPIPSLRSARGDVPAALDAIFHKMVAKKTADRYQTMTEVIEALEGCLRGESAVPSISAAPSEEDRLHAFLAGIAHTDAGLRPATGRKTATPTLASPATATDATVALAGSDIQTDPQTLASLSGTKARKGRRPVSLPPWLADRRVQIGARATAGVALLLAVVMFFWRTEKLEVNADGQSLGSKPSSKSLGGSKLDWLPKSTNDTAAPNTDPPDYALHLDPKQMIQIPIPGAGLTSDGPFTIELSVQADRDDFPNYVHLVTMGPAALGYSPEYKGWHARVYDVKHSSRSTPAIETTTHRTHLAAIYERSRIHLYADGKLIGTGDVNDPKPSHPVEQIDLGNHTLDFAGIIDEVRLSKGVRYDRDFTPSERFEPDKSTIALYHFDEGSGDLLRDSSGNGYDGKRGGAKWVLADGTPTPGSSFADWATPNFGEWVSLFNGRDLTGWKADTDAYSFENGVLVATTRGELISTKTYADFEAELEFRLAEKTAKGWGTHTGFGFRGAEENPRQLGLVVPLLTDQGNGERSDKGKRGALMGAAESTADPFHPWPQWNTLRVVCLGKNLTIEMNGVPLVQANTADLLNLNPRHSGLPRSNGHFSLLTTKGRAEFRNLRVREATWGSAAQPDGDGWVTLFNGRNLRGWTPKGQLGWGVKNGILVGETSGSPGWLMSDREFTDIELELEYKLSPGSNSGVFLRTWSEEIISGSQFPEVQLLDDDAPQFANTPPQGKTGAIWQKVAPKPTPKAPANQWHRVQVRLAGSQVQVTLNGVQVVDYQLPDVRPQGHIGLQLFSGRVEFRNIRVHDASVNAAAASPVSTEVDLLKPLDLERDVIAGYWELQGTALVTPIVAPSGQCRLQFPSPRPVPDEYDVELEIERKAAGGTGLSFGFVMGGRQGVVNMDSYSNPNLWALQDIDGKSGRDNPTRNPGQRLPLHERKTVLIQVRRDRVRVSLAGETIIDWQGRPEQLSTTFWSVPDKQALFLGSQSRMLVHRAVLRRSSTRW